MPPFADANTSAAVMFEGFVSGVAASVKHALPNPVLRTTLSKTVGGGFMCSNFSAKATTRSGESVEKIPSGGCNRVATITSASPLSAAIKVSRRANHKQSAKDTSNQIRSGSSQSTHYKPKPARLEHGSWWCGLNRAELHSAIKAREPEWRMLKARFLDHIGEQMVGYREPVQKKRSNGDL